MSWFIGQGGPEGMRLLAFLISLKSYIAAARYSYGIWKIDGCVMAWKPVKSFDSMSMMMMIYWTSIKNDPQTFLQSLVFRQLNSNDATNPP